MDKQRQHADSIEAALRALDRAFASANAAEVIVPRMPISERWQLPDPQRAAAEHAELASYDVTPAHWGARLALMSAFESLHAALRIVSATSLPDPLLDLAWREAGARAAEASRLAREAERVLGPQGGATREAERVFAPQGGAARAA